MSALITCGRADNALISMNNCKKCYYKRLPEDVSTVFCTYRIKENARISREAVINNLTAAIEGSRREQQRLYITGYPLQAEALSERINKMIEEREEKIIVNEALTHIESETNKLIKQLVDVINDIIDIGIMVKKIAEEHLKTACTGTAAAEKLLSKEKSVTELYIIIEAESRKKEITLADAERIADEYYELKE